MGHSAVIQLSNNLVPTGGHHWKHRCGGRHRRSHGRELITRAGGGDGVGGAGDPLQVVRYLINLRTIPLQRYDIRLSVARISFDTLQVISILRDI